MACSPALPCPFLLQLRPTTRPLCSTWWASGASPTWLASSTCASSEWAAAALLLIAEPRSAVRPAQVGPCRHRRAVPARPPALPSCLLACQPLLALLLYLSMPAVSSQHAKRLTRPSLRPPRRRLVQAAFTPKAIRGYMPRMQVNRAEMARLLCKGHLPPACGAVAALAFWACSNRLRRTLCAGPACRRWRRRRCRSGLHRATSCEFHPGAPQLPPQPWLATCLLQMPAVRVELVCVCTQVPFFSKNLRDKPCLRGINPPSLPAAPTTR